MSSWYSNLLTKTSSQISNLRSTLLSSEADGDTEDDTHVCRVLRNYYTEKGRPLPTWLPPDPKAATQVPQTLYAQPQVGSRYGGLGTTPQAGAGAAGGLSSLWDNNPGGQGQAPPPQTPQSLRVGRVPVGGREELVSRPAPGSRSGSYQPPASVGPAGGGTAQDRLKQRLWGSRTTSPGNQGANGPFQPPPGSGGPVGGNSGGGGGAYGSGRSSGGGGDRPYVGANAPWSTGGDDFYGGGGGPGPGPGPGPSAGAGAGGSGSARQGLPSNGPRRQGLPSGPRGYR